MGYLNELLLIIILVVSLVSCKQAERIAANDDLNHIISQDETSKIYLSEASNEQLEKRLEDCPPNANAHRQCFLICHVPPGNPNNSHSLILPMPAVNAHMTHGMNGHGPEKSDKGKGKGKGEYRGDYMGRCDGSGTGGTTGGTADGSTTGGTTDGGSTGGTDGGTTDGGSIGGTSGGTSTGGTTGDDDPPIFCEWTHPNDLDCDGRHDDTGELIF